MIVAFNQSIHKSRGVLRIERVLSECPRIKWHLTRVPRSQEFVNRRERVSVDCARIQWHSARVPTHLAGGHMIERVS